MWNPLFDLWKTVGGESFEMEPFERLDMSFRRFAARDNGICEYAFAIPTAEVITRIVEKAPRLVELGAGTGYWAKLLTEAGADVVAFDRVPAGEQNGFGKQQVAKWFPVQHGTVDAIVSYRDMALLLNWPPYNSPMAADAVRRWGGDLVVYIGEGHGGCTADDDFHEMMDREFECVEIIEIPQWFGIHDSVYLFQRRVAA